MATTVTIYRLCVDGDMENVIPDQKCIQINCSNNACIAYSLVVRNGIGLETTKLWTQLPVICYWPKAVTINSGKQYSNPLSALKSLTTNQNRT